MFYEQGRMEILKSNTLNNLHCTIQMKIQPNSNAINNNDQLIHEDHK